MASAEEAAIIRLSYTDSEEVKKVIALETTTRETSNQAKAFPKGAEKDALPHLPAVGSIVNGRPQGLWVDEGGRILVEAKSEAADTVESEECSGNIPILLYDKSSGIVTSKTLILGDVGVTDDNGFTGFNSTNDVALVTTAFNRLGYWPVPSGKMATFDSGPKFHLYLGDDTA